MTPELRAINSLTKYPSILTYHELGDKGRLLETLTRPAPGDGPFYLYEKIDGENARLIFVRGTDGALDYFIGSREELLYAKGDRLAVPTGGIAELLKPLAARLAEELADPLYADCALVTLYAESYGGKTSAARHYTKERAQHYRFFDGMALRREPLEAALALPPERLAAWRDKGGQPYWPEAGKTAFARRHGLAAAPLLGTAEALPVSVDATYEWLGAYAATQAAIDGEGGRSEGLIVRSADRSFIKKIRFEDYERTRRAR